MPSQSICSADECEQPARGRGLCYSHYHQAARRGTLPPLIPLPSLIGITEKACTRCGVLQPASGFSADKRHRDGLQSQCNACARERVTQYYAQFGQTEEYRAKGKDWRTRNHEELLKRKRAYRNANLDVVRERDRQWLERNRAEVNARVRARYWANRESKLQALRHYYHAHGDRFRELGRARYAQNIADFRRRSEEYRQRRRERMPAIIVATCRVCGAEVPRAKNESFTRRCPNCLAAAHREQTHLRRARLRGRTRERVTEQALLRRDGAQCGICGKPMQPRERSIDHLLPVARGGAHTFANTRLVHLSCNVRRGAFGVAQLRMFGE